MKCLLTYNFSCKTKTKSTNLAIDWLISAGVECFAFISCYGTIIFVYSFFSTVFYLWHKTNNVFIQWHRMIWRFMKRLCVEPIGVGNVCGSFEGTQSNKIPIILWLTWNKMGKFKFQDDFNGKSMQLKWNAEYLVLNWFFLENHLTLNNTIITVLNAFHSNVLKVIDFPSTLW